MLISSVFGIIIGIIAAVNRDRWLDKTLMSLSITGISMPSFLLALLLMLLLVSQWHLLPASGREGSPFTAEGFKYIILPALTLGISGTASIARLTRSSVVAVLNEEFVMTLKAKGLRRKMILFKHILRNASLPILTMIGLDFGYLLGGAVVTETIFAWPGIGKYAMDAISQNDFPAVQGSVLILSMMFMLINLVVDLLYGVLDPRVSLEYGVHRAVARNHLCLHVLQSAGALRI